MGDAHVRPLRRREATGALDMIPRKFIITYLDSRGRVVHRANHNGKWYWQDFFVWRRLSRKPKLVERYA
jgi:hypothetical protein